MRDTATSAAVDNQQSQRKPNVNLHTADATGPFVHQHFSAQAAARPDTLAVAACSVRLTYGELERRANLFAHYLRSLDIGPECVVALYMRRSPELIITALAALKAGAAYLPIDPDIPPERLLFMVRDCQAKLVVTESSMVERISGVECPMVRIDSIGTMVERYDTAAPEVSLRPENLAYVIYTSGSTGLPKGVEITHSNLANLVSWHNRAFQVSSTDRASHLAGLGFDASVWETWPYLAAGASLWLAEPDTLISPENLQAWLIANRLTISFVPTPMTERLLSLQWPSGTALRLLLTGGDTLHVRPPAGLPFTVVNNYGPTECTVVATSGIVLPSPSASLPSIGKPIDNSQVYILDERLHPVPAGERGELYVGGTNVGRGYRYRPELTSERFIANPLDPGERLYRTGDIGQYLPDGEIAFLGRSDNQIKIRGYRIEPDEIAAVLNTHRAVAASAVTTGGDGDDKRLIAYIVAKAGVRRRELQEFLMKGLPDYMVPAIYVMVDALPLTSNGKVNCAALPAATPDNVLGDSASGPASEIEDSLAQLVTSLLNVREVGPDDDFFLLGGHSLLGTQLIARIRDKFGVELALRTLFEQPTVRALSAEIERLLVAKLDTMSEEDAQRALHGSDHPLAPAA